MKKDPVEGKWRKGGAEEKTKREAASSSIEEEALTAANDSLCGDSIPSVVDEKGIEWQHRLSTNTTSCMFAHSITSTVIEKI